METEVNDVDLECNSDNPANLKELLPHQLVQKLRVLHGVLPKEAIREIQRRRDEMVPSLIEILEEGIERIRAGDVSNDNGSFFSFILLIEFKAELASDVFFRAIVLEGERFFDLVGDAVHEFLPLAVPGILHQWSDKVLALACSPMVDPWVRSSLAKGIGLLADAGKQPREQVIEMLRRVLQVAVEERNDLIISLIAVECAQLRLPELLGDIRETKRLELLDEGMISLCEVEEYLERPSEPSNYCLKDTIEAVEHWGSFSPKSYAPAPAPPPASMFLRQPSTEIKEEFAVTKPTTIRKDAPHIGRNNPCPCLSGKKFKKCCGRGDSFPDL